MKKIKKADRYVTFVPFGEEKHLFLDRPPFVTSTNSKFLEYGAETKTYKGQTYYQYTADTPEKLKMFTNAYELRYMAIYKGEEFGILIDYKDPIVTLVGDFQQSKKFPEFKIWEKGVYHFDIDISKVNLVPIKTPIDLSKYLPNG